MLKGQRVLDVAWRAPPPELCNNIIGLPGQLCLSLAVLHPLNTLDHRGRYTFLISHKAYFKWNVTFIRLLKLGAIHTNNALFWANTLYDLINTSHFWTELEDGEDKHSWSSTIDGRGSPRGYRLLILHFTPSLRYTHKNIKTELDN